MPFIVRLPNLLTPPTALTPSTYQIVVNARTGTIPGSGRPLPHPYDTIERFDVAEWSETHPGTRLDGQVLNIHELSHWYRQRSHEYAGGEREVRWQSPVTAQLRDLQRATAAALPNGIAIDEPWPESDDL